MLDPAYRWGEAAHFNREALDGAVEADSNAGQDCDLVLDRADAVENAVELTGEELEADVGHSRDYATLMDADKRRAIGMEGLSIRAAAPSDRPQLRLAVIELQDSESRLHPSRLPGDQIADAYLDWIEKRAAERGALLIAEIDRAFVGFVAGWIEEESHICEAPEYNRFGYVSDICVLPAYRGRRIASRLLDAMERRLRLEGVARVRLFTLVANRAARATYERSGYAAYEVVYEKPL
jgi:ribosomal protein S18 acetylase RimI-like enzyme